MSMMKGIWFTSAKHNSATDNFKTTFISLRSNQSTNSNTKETTVHGTRIPTHLPDPFRDQ